MSNNVDKRVVQMQFDNKEFERRVKTTRTSLKGLKEDLNFDDNVQQLSKLEKATKDFDLSSMAAGIESISNRFSTMGIVGFRVIQNLTDSVLSFGKKIANSTIGQILTGGRNRALNLEQAQFQISGLGVDWEKKQATGVSLRDQIDKAVSGTAYGLDAAAKVAGQLLASNIKAGSKEMQAALSGISGVAAMTNSTYEDIGHIFTTIAGNGRIMGEQLTQFAGRGLNVASELAKYLTKLNGGIEVTEAEVREMASEGQIDFTTFANAMNEAFGKQATKANETYTGALSNTKAALSRIGAEIQQPYLENMRKTFVALIPVLNGVKKALGPMFEVAKSGMEFLSKEAVTFLEKYAFLDDDNKLQLKGIQSFSDRIKSVVENLQKKDLAGNSVFDYIRKSYESTKYVFSGLKRIVSSVITPFRAAFSEMFPSHGVFGNVAAVLQKISSYIEDLGKKFDKATDSGERLRKIFSGIFSIGKMIVSAFTLIAKVGSKVVDVFASLFGIVLRVLAPIGELATNLYYFFKESEEVKAALSPLIKSFNTLKDTIKLTVSIFKEAFVNAFAPFVKESNKTSKLLSFLTKVLTKFAEITSKVFNAISKWLTKHKESIEKFGSGLGKVLGKILEFFRKVWSVTKIIFGGLKDGFKGFRDGIAKVADSFGTIKTDGIKKFSERFKASTGPIQALGRFLASVWELGKSILSKIGPLVKTLVTFILDSFSSIARIIKNGIDKLDIGKNAPGFLAAGGVVALLINLLKKFNSIKPEKIIDAISAMMSKLTAEAKNAKKQKTVNTMKAFASAILELAIAMVIISSIDPERLVASLGAISALMWEFSGVMKAVNSTAATTGNSFNWKTKTFTQTSSNIGEIGKVILMMSGAILMLAASIKILAGLEPEKMMEGIVAVSVLLWELVAIIKVLGNSENTMQKGLSALLFMAISVRILIKAVAGLSKLSWEELAKGLIGTIALMLALSAAVKIISKSKGILRASIGMVLIAEALKLLIPVVEKFAALEWKELGKAGAAIGGLLLALSLFSRIVKGGKLLASSVAMIGIAASLRIFAVSMQIFGNMNWLNIAKAGSVIGGLLLALSLFSRIVKGGKLLASSVAMIGIATSLRIFASSFMIFGNMDWISIAKSGSVIVGLLLTLTLFSRFAKGLKLLVLATSLIIFGIALSEFAGVLKLYSSFSWESIAKGLGAIVAVLLLFGIAAKVLKGSIATILGLSSAMLMFGAGITLLGVGIVLIAAGLSALSGSLALTAKALQFIIMTILELLPLILDLVRRTLLGLIRIVADSVPALVQAFVAIGTALLNSIIELAPKVGEALIALLDTFLPILEKYVPKLCDSIVKILIGVIDVLSERVPEVVYAVAKFIKKLVGAIADVARTEFNINSLKEVVLGFAAMAAIFIAIALAGKLAQKAWKGLVIISGVMTLITLMFLVLSTINTQTFVNIAEGLSEAMLAISASMFIISKVPVTGAITGMEGFALVVAGLVAILEILGAIGQIPGFTWLLEEGTRVLGLIGKAIGEFVGNIVGGILSGISSNLPAVATSLSEFMVNLGPFIEGAKQMTPTMFDGMLDLVGVILALTAASFLKQISDFIGFFIGKVSFEDLGKELCKFGETMIEFSEVVKPLDETALEHIKHAGDAAKALADFASAVPKTGGLLGAIVGNNDVDDWGEKLPVFGEGLVAFSKSVSKLDEDAIAKIKLAAEAGVTLAEMADKIPNSGGILGGIMGENDVDKWGKQLPTFGKGLAALAESTRSFNQSRLDSIKMVCEAGTALADMSEHIPNEGGVKAFFAGDNSLAKFAPQIEKFGSSMKKLADTLKGVSVDGVMPVIEVAKAIALMSQEIPNSGGIASLFSGDSSLEDFGEELEDFGPHLKKFVDSIIGVSPDTVAVAMECTSLVFEILEEDNDYDLSRNAIDVAEAMKALADKDFGKNLASFASAIAKEVALDKDAFSAAIDCFMLLFNGLASWDNKTDLSRNAIDVAEAMTAINNAKVGERLAAFASSISTINNESFASGMQVFKVLFDSLASWEEFDLSNNATDVGEAIDELNTLKVGDSLKTFASSLGDIEKETFAAALDCFVVLFNALGSWEEFDLSNNATDVGEAIDELNTLKVGDSLKTFADSIAHIDTSKFSESLDCFSTLFTSLGSIKENSASSNAKDISAALGELFDGGVAENYRDFMKGIHAVSMPIYKDALDIFVSMCDAFASWKKDQDMSANATDVSQALMTLITDNVAENYKTFMKGIHAISMPIYQEAFDVFAGVLDSFASLPKDGALEKASSDAANAINVLNDQDVATSFVAFMKGIHAISAATYKDAFELVLSMLDSFADDKMERIGSNASSISSGINALASINISGIISTFRFNKSVNLDKVIDNVKKVIGISKPFADLSSVNENDVVSFVSSFNELAKVNVEAFKKAFSSDEAINGAVDAGTNFLKSIIEGISKYKSTATTNISKVATEISKSVIDKMKAYQPNFVSIGKYYVEGLANGMSDNGDVAVVAAKKVASNIISGTKMTLQEKSPSKEGAEIGKFWDYGLANGVITYSNAVSKASEGVADTIVHTAVNTMNGLNSINFDDVDMNPTIRPVFDLTEVNRGVGQINGMLSNTRAYTISTDISKDKAKLLKDGETIKVETTNSDVVAAVNELRSDLVAMKDELSKFGIYLDGDTLVGELAPGMDAALGRRKKYYDRRG